MQLQTRMLAADNAWSLERLRHECPNSLYNHGWDGYRLADMLQSRFQRRSNSGLNYHLRLFPHSIVAEFANGYKMPNKKNNLRSARYEALTGGSCHPGGNLSAFPINGSSCGRESLALHLQCCSYVLPVPALTDILQRRQQTQRSESQQRFPSPSRRTAAVHLRLGEVVDLSPCRVDAMMKNYTRFDRRCPTLRTKHWHGTPCMRQNAFEYVMPTSFFQWVSRELAARQIRRVVLVAGSALNLTMGFSKSCDYLSRVAAFFASAGFELGYRLGRPPDDDLDFFAHAHAMVPTGGAFSKFASRAAAQLGVDVLLANRGEPPSIWSVPHQGGKKPGSKLTYIC